jgi:proline dehydrogenase
MGMARNALLWVSQNQKLRERLPRYRFIRKAVTRFMPGETLEEALSAANILQKKHGINTILTQLGENISDPTEAANVTQHYKNALETIQNRNINGYISVKPTQLGLDLNEELCYENTALLAAEAAKRNNWVWIDMEQSQYVDRTLNLYKRLRKNFTNTGVCVQAYLYRTAKDIEDLFSLSPAIRLVKGAYAEPKSVAFPDKSDVDTNYLKLSKTILSRIRSDKITFGVATHDRKLIGQIQTAAVSNGLTGKDYEIQQLYGIQSAEQKRIAGEGYRMRVLISYGSYWFPWYVRRLAERPANVWFVVKNMFS